EVLLHRIGDLSEWVELGPHCDVIERIEVRPINCKDNVALSLAHVMSCTAETVSSSPRDDALSNSSRWRAIVYYRGDKGPNDIEMSLREIADLHCRIEDGLHPDGVIRADIRRINHIDSPTLTLEQALGRRLLAGRGHLPRL